MTMCSRRSWMRRTSARARWRACGSSTTCRTACTASTPSSTSGRSASEPLQDHAQGPRGEALAGGSGGGQPARLLL